jgi:pentose-5-phosphate-3-epimerase
MKKKVRIAILVIILSTQWLPAWAWHDETHVAIAKVAGYKKWFNATGADMVKVKAGWIEKRNHYVNNPRNTIVTPKMVLDQVSRYDQTGDSVGHLYGAIVASVKKYMKVRQSGKYAEYHLAFAAHYIGDLSQPLHNTVYNRYNRTYHIKTDGTINHEVLDQLHRINIYDISIASEMDLAREIARIANLSMKLGYRLEDEKRLLTRQEAYQQISHSASLFKAVLKYVKR